MKVLVNNDGKIVGLATDEYSRPMDNYPAPEGFDLDQADLYEIVDGVVTYSIDKYRANLVVTPLQFTEWLEENQFSVDQTYMERIVEILQGLPTQQRQRAIRRLNKASEFRRDYPLIEQIRTVLGMTPEEMDAAFEEALLIV